MLRHRVPALFCRRRSCNCVSLSRSNLPISSLVRSPTLLGFAPVTRCRQAFVEVRATAPPSLSHGLHAPSRHCPVSILSFPRPHAIPLGHGRYPDTRMRSGLPQVVMCHCRLSPQVPFSAVSTSLSLCRHSFSFASSALPGVSHVTGLWCRLRRLAVSNDNLASSPVIHQHHHQ